MRKRIALILFASCLLVLMPINLMLAGDVVQVLINGKPLVSDVPAQIIDGRTMVPLRAVSESLDCKVDWYDGKVYVWNTKKMNTAAPTITAPDNIKSVLQAALDRMDANTYSWVIEYVDEINTMPEITNSWGTKGTVIAFASEEAKLIQISEKYFNDISSKLSTEDLVLFYVGVLTHEAAHNHFDVLNCDKIYSFNDQEALCDMAAMRAITKAGGSKSSYAYKWTLASFNMELSN